MQAIIESRFIFNRNTQDVSYISDDDGQILGFNKLANGSSVIYTKDKDGIEVAIEHCIDGTKIFHMTKDSKGLPAMHEIRPDGSEFIYLFDAEKRLEKMIEIKSNNDKVTQWFSEHGDTIIQEQRQKGGILFSMYSSDNKKALVWLHPDGKLERHGDETLQSHLKKVFAKYLDGDSQ